MYSKKTSEFRVPLAVRLAGALTFILGTCLGVTFVLVYLVIASIAYNRVDEKLRHEAAEISARVAVDGLDAVQEALARAAHEEGTNQILYRMIDAAGHIKMESGTTGWEGVGVSQKAIDPANGPGPVFETVGIMGDRETARVVYAPLAPGLTLQIAMRLLHEIKPIQDLGRILLLGGALALIFSALIGYFIAWRALTPLQVMTNTALSIASGNLTERMQATSRDVELHRLSSAFNMMLDQIQSFVRELRDLNDSIAHDVRTVLTRTRLAAERLLATHPLSEEQETAAVAIIEDSEVLFGMMNTVMDLSEMNTGIASTKFAPIDLNELTTDIFEFFEISAQEKGIDMHLQTSGSAMVVGDVNRLRRAVANLFDNAIKYTGPGGKIEVAVRANAANVSVTVADTGIGIPSEAQPRVFDRFYRVDSSRSGAGHGLGLSLAAAVARLHGGSIQVQSTEGKGSTFTVILPRSTPDPAAS